MQKKSLQGPIKMFLMLQYTNMGQVLDHQHIFYRNVKYNKNSRIMQLIIIILQNYTQVLEKDGWLDKSNLVPSYSMMHTLQDGYQIEPCSFTHNTDSSKLLVHQKSLLRTIVGPNMGIMWHKALHHCGSKSRLNPATKLAKDDMRLFICFGQKYN